MITEASYPGNAQDSGQDNAAPGGNAYIGLMSGTSMDGVDGVLALLPASEPSAGAGRIEVLAYAYVAFSDSLRAELMALQTSGPDEIHREAMAGVQIAGRYAECVAALRRQRPDVPVIAIGAHGQTIRHRPELGYTRQTNHPALLAEIAGIDVIADFRSRDVAAGGQGAPLVPAFHQAIFGGGPHARVVVNIGGIANLSLLPAAAAAGTTAAAMTGFDTGPGNALMDGWIARHLQQPYDKDGAWAASGAIHAPLLSALLDEPYFRQPAPKSTGRDLFHMQWLDDKLAPFGAIVPADVQATLTALTAYSIAEAIAAHAPDATDVYVCGGGAYNGYLLELLRLALAEKIGDGDTAPAVQTTDALGVPPNQVEALAFAWLAQRFTEWLPGNVPTVTGAIGWRMLGALYPA